MKGFALGLTLKQRQKRTCKWVILVHCSSYCTSTGGGGGTPIVELHRFLLLEWVQFLTC